MTQHWLTEVTEEWKGQRRFYGQEGIGERTALGEPDPKAGRSAPAVIADDDTLSSGTNSNYIPPACGSFAVTDEGVLRRLRKTA